MARAQARAGRAIWPPHLLKVLRGRNPITALVFNEDLAAEAASNAVENVRVLPARNVDVRELSESFDHIIATGILPPENYKAGLSLMHRLLKPAGQILLFERNPGNFFTFVENLVNLRRKSDLLAAMNSIGFVDSYLHPYDMVSGTIKPSLARRIKSKLLVLEHLPFLRSFCATQCVWARKSGKKRLTDMSVDLAQHPQLFDSVSVVVPCHNEEMNVQPLVSGMLSLYGPYIREIILVNDNSTDRTGEVAAAIARDEPRVKVINRGPPNGVGLALKEGYALAGGSYILSMDCDFVHLSQFQSLFDAVAAGYDGAIGSRFSHDSVVASYPAAKLICNRAVHVLVQLLVWRRVRDITNNLKLYRSEIFKSLPIQESHFAANLEIGLYPLLAKRRILEAPVSWVNRREEMGTSSFRLLWAGPQYVRVLLRAVWNWSQFRSPRSE